MSFAIWWIRRDLRLFDNPALRAALERYAVVLPVFILDPVLWKNPAPRRQSFLLAGLRQLDEDLRRRGSRLVVRNGEPLEVMETLMAESAAQAIFVAEDYSPYAQQRDDKIAARFPLHRVLDVTIHHPSAVRKPDGSPYTVYGAFRKAWLGLPLLHHAAWLPPERFQAPPGLHSDPLPEAIELPGSVLSPQAPALADFPPGEDEAQRRLARFVDGPLDTYAVDRDGLDLEGTSGLSPYLHLGMLSPLQAYRAAHQAAKVKAGAITHPAGGNIHLGYQSWVNELIWREFYHAILYSFPEVLKTAYNPALRAVSWRDPAGEAAGDLHAWQEGQTGYPLVDACMRQLAHTGWMHNRGRMVVASFLVKDLLINWQVGERWFMRQLVDGDLAANNGGWQWAAGVGTDAAPYFRVFNPVLQGKKFDPHGVFVRRWLPELAGLPDQFVHQPWLALRPVTGYPSPLVDHAVARGRALAAFRQARLPRE